MIGLATNAMTGCTGTFALAWLRSAEASDLFGVNPALPSLGRR